MVLIGEQARAMEEGAGAVLLVTVGLLLVGFVVERLWRTLWWEPLSIKRAFEGQGVTCLPYRPLVGNLPEISRMFEAALSSPPELPHGCHDIAPRILPHYCRWKKELGDRFVFWMGYRAVLPVSNPELIREILSNKFGHFKKLSLRPEARDMVGDSVGSLEGGRWAQHRRIVGPAFFTDKIKAMAPTMISCIRCMLDKWDDYFLANETGTTLATGSFEVNVQEEFKMLTADIIAHTAFGSSYEEGKLVFKLQQEQQILVAKLGRSIHIPGYRFLPTPQNRYAERINRQIKKHLMNIIQSRAKQGTVGNDLLGVLLAANKNEVTGSKKNLSLTMEEIMGECKTFFFAGHETTANLMTWTTMLLACHQEWQEKTREEVLQICGKQTPSVESLNNIKVVSMVLNEALRLYPPGAMLVRQTAKAMKLGDILVPPNVGLLIPTLCLHHDTSIWGDSALEFDPHRFANGIGDACKVPSAFFPFSMGPRICIGQAFALLEAKLILTMMLQRFKFSVSPNYKHTPGLVITLQPQAGMQIILQKLI